MNKFVKFLAVGLIPAMSFSLASCSDDDPEYPSGPSTDNVFENGLPAAVDGATFETNDKGQLTKILDGSDVVTFEYGTFTPPTRANNFTVLMKVRETTTRESAGDNDFDIYMELNRQGFVTYAYQVYYDGSEADEWKFEYNNAGQLTHMWRSESDETFTMTYSGGDVVKTVKDEGDGDHREYTFAYTNDEFKTIVPNKGNLMLFDDCFQVEIDEMEMAYYAGLLGKASANLPMGYTETGKEGGSTYTYEEVYHWEFNANKLPIKFWEGEYISDAVTFSWK